MLTIAGLPPNRSLERTHQPVIKFAYANLLTVGQATQLRCCAAPDISPYTVSVHPVRSK